MRITDGPNRYETNEGENIPLFLEAKIQFPGKSVFLPVKFLLDSGSTGPGSIVIPKSFLKEMGVSAPVVGNLDAGLADGHIEHDLVIQINLRVQQIPSNRPLLIEGITASVNDGETFLLGMGVLGLCKTMFDKGKIVLLEFNPKSLE